MSTSPYDFKVILRGSRKDGGGVSAIWVYWNRLSPCSCLISTALPSSVARSALIVVFQLAGTSVVQAQELRPAQGMQRLLVSQEPVARRRGAEVISYPGGGRGRQGGSGSCRGRCLGRHIRRIYKYSKIQRGI